MRNSKINYILIFVIGLLTSWAITRFIYKNVILENDFRNKVAMTSIDKKIMDLLIMKEYDQAIELLKEKIKFEITEVETEWFIRGDSMYKNILYPTILDTGKLPETTDFK